MSIQSLLAKKATGSVSKSASAPVKNKKAAASKVKGKKEAEPVKYEPRFLDEKFGVEYFEEDGRKYMRFTCPIDEEANDEADEVEAAHGYSDRGFRLSTPNAAGTSKSETLVSTSGSRIINGLPKKLAKLFPNRQVYLNITMSSPFKSNPHLDL